MKIICGIDPGLQGFICIIKADKNVKVDFIPMPTIKINNKNQIDIPNLVKSLKKYKFDEVYLELVHSITGQGVCSVWSFGEGYGIIKGVLTALGYDFTLVSPQKWKNALIPQELRVLDKKSSCEAAKLIAKKEGWVIDFPQHKKSKELFDGATDAFCIAYYGFKNAINK